MPMRSRSAERDDPRDERLGVVSILAVGRRKSTEHRRQQHRSRESFAKRRRRDMQRIAAAGREAHQYQLGVGIFAAHHRDEVGHVVIEFTGIVDVAAHAGSTMAADVRREDRNAFSAERFAERMDTRALRRRAVDGDDDERRVRRRPCLAATRGRRSASGCSPRGVCTAGKSPKLTARNGAPSEASGCGVPPVPNASMPASAAAIGDEPATTKTMTQYFHATVHWQRFRHNVLFSVKP